MNVLKRAAAFVREEQNRPAILFTAEGILHTLVSNVVSGNNNLFAQRLGATDIQLSLVSALPQLMGLLILLPGGILSDRLKNKRTLLAAALLCVAFFYGLIAFTPFLPKARLEVFLGLLALASAPLVLYNMIWPAYFSDVVTLEQRNYTLTLRSYGTLCISFFSPLITGTLLASAPTNAAKISLHQLFFLLAVGFLFTQWLLLRRVPGGGVTPESKRTLRGYGEVIVQLAKDKRFLGFAGVALFFYLSWHIDWTMYYIGEVNYLHYDEAWLSYISIGNAVVQFVTIPIWSRINRRMGVRLGIIFGALGLSMNPLAMILSTSLPAGVGPTVFLCAHILSGFALATTSLNVVQNLLQVVPVKNKTLAISLYTMLTTFSNMLMPVMGVRIYTALGADLTALHGFFWLVFGLRLAAAALWALRWLRARRDPGQLTTSASRPQSPPTIRRLKG
ncbi:MAG: MFS transporter [Oscillospiraceae bacterium]|jgi:MFS family permease|nr:MFS transporter [Oscillospiraceae bacterium]